MRKCKRHLPIDKPLSCDNTITMDLLLLHAEIIATMSYQLIVLNKSSLVEKQLDTLASCQFMIAMLLVNSGLASTKQSLLLDLVETFNECLALEARESTKTHWNELSLLSAFQSQSLPANRLHLFFEIIFLQGYQLIFYAIEKFIDLLGFWGFGVLGDFLMILVFVPLGDMKSQIVCISRNLTSP